MAAMLNDRRVAQSACTWLELEYGLEHAPRRRVGPKLSVIAERQQARAQDLALVSHRAVQEAERIPAEKLLEEHLRIHRDPGFER